MVETVYCYPFLWFPKKINGKWYWLRKVTKKMEYQKVCIGIDVSYRLIKTTYIL